MIVERKTVAVYDGSGNLVSKEVTTIEEPCPNCGCLCECTSEEEAQVEPDGYDTIGAPVNVVSKDEIYALLTSLGIPVPMPRR